MKFKCMIGFGLLFLVASVCLSQDSLHVHRIGELGQNWSSPQDVVVSGNYAYVATQSTGIFVLDVTNRSQPHVVASVRNVPASKFALVGNTLYACSYEGLFILDVTTPTFPTIIGRYLTVGDLNNMAVSGNYAYLLDNHIGLIIVDISNPLQITEAGRCTTGTHPYEVAISGNYAYIVNIFDGLRIVDIRVPSQPTLVGSCTIPDNSMNVAVIGNYALVSSEDGIHTINVSNPTNPQIVATFDSTWYSYMRVQGQYGYFSGGQFLDIYDVSNPLSLSRIGRYSHLEQMQNLSIASDYAYVLLNYGIGIVSVASPTTPAFVGSYTTDTYSEMAKSGSTVFLKSRYGITIADVSQSANPSVIGRIDSLYYYSSLVASGRYLLGSRLRYNGFNLAMYDILNPANPVLTDTLANVGAVEEIVLSGSYAYLMTQRDSIHIVDISNPQDLRRVCSITVSGWLHGIGVYGSYLYTATLDSGLMVIDLHDFLNPIRVNLFPSMFDINAILVVGDYLYLSKYYGVFIYELTNPMSPRYLGFTDSYFEGQTLAVAGDYLFFGDYTQTLRIFNITDRSHPVEVGFYHTRKSIRNIDISGNRANLLELPDFAIYDFSEALPVIERASNIVPHEFALHANYPNPFNAVTTISYDLSETSPVKLSIYDITGKEVKTLLNFHQNAGRYSVQWDAKEFSSGTYLCRLQAGEHSRTQKLLLLK